MVRMRMGMVMLEKRTQTSSYSSAQSHWIGSSTCRVEKEKASATEPPILSQSQDRTDQRGRSDVHTDENFTSNKLSLLKAMIPQHDAFINQSITYGVQPQTCLHYKASNCMPAFSSVSAQMLYRNLNPSEIPQLSETRKSTSIQHCKNESSMLDSYLH